MYRRTKISLTYFKLHFSVGVWCQEAHIVSDPSFGFFALQTSLINGGYQSLCWYSKNGLDWTSRYHCNPELENFAIASNGIIIATRESETANNYGYAFSKDGGQTWSASIPFRRPTGRPSIIAGKFVMPLQDTLSISADAIEWNTWLSIRNDHFIGAHFSSTVSLTCGLVFVFRFFGGEYHACSDAKEPHHSCFQII
jgi:hypothetical protein